MNIIITGCSKGIGYELVKLMSCENKVYAVSRNILPIEKLKSNSDYSDNIIPLSFDVAQLKQSQFDQLISENKIDVLINNAGRLINKPFVEITKSDYDAVMETNFFGVVNMIQLSLNKLTNASGQIINIGSVGGLQGSVKFPGLSMYSSSKGALSILTECLALELSELNIKVNCLALGAVQTEMLGEAFPGYKADISPSEMADYIYNFIRNSSKLSNGLNIPVKKTNP